MYTQVIEGCVYVFVSVLVKTVNLELMILQERRYVFKQFNFNSSMILLFEKVYFSYFRKTY